VYERTGGHAYGSVYPGPIGAVLSPQLTGVADNASLPFASTLCGACYDACPVAIDIPTMLVHLRSRVVQAEAAGHRAPSPERAAMAAAGWAMRSPRRWTWALRLGRLGRPLGWLPRVGAIRRDVAGRGAAGGEASAEPGSAGAGAGGWRIRRLPPPLAAWTRSRDLPLLPRQTFRDWWRAR
jgi:L-lactate dehydrogenase complex protein LldF